jgi:hypothetical protein
VKLADFAKDSGYEDAEGLYCETADTLLQSGILGFCCCGTVPENLRYISAGLELIGEKSPKGSGDEWNAWYKGWRKRVDDHFKSSAAEYFFFYWADKEKLTEHGGCVPGWLTDKGKDLLAMLREWAAGAS